MAVKTLYIQNVTTNGMGQMTETAPAASTTAQGWVTATNVAGQACIMAWNSELARNATGWGTAGTNVLTTDVAPTNVANGNALVAGPFTGTFANTAWTFTFVFRSVTAANGGKVIVNVQLWKGPNADGTSATRIGTGRTMQTAAGAATLTTTADYVTTGTWTPGSTTTFNNEYIFAVISLQVSTAGSGTTSDADWRITGSTGSAATLCGITTSDFAPATIVSLTGVSATSAVGTTSVIFPVLNKSITGVSATSAVGTTSVSTSSPVTFPLDFTTGALPAGVTATGGTNGTRTNSSGNIVSASAPRFGYTNAGVSRGIIIEPAATNTTYPSNDVGAWDQVNNFVAASSTSNQTAGPDGTTSAAKFSEDTSTSSHFGGPTGVTSFTSVPWTTSIYLKAGTATVAQLLVGSPASTAYANFNLSTGAVGTTGNGATAGIESAGNGWYRCWISYTPSAVSTSGLFICLANNNTSAIRTPNYTGTGAYIYAWGAQVELGTGPTTLIPTTSANVTRSADNVSFTTPSGATSFRHTFDDGSTQDVTVTPGATYTYPTNLNRSRITGTAVPASDASPTLTGVSASTAVGSIIVTTPGVTLVNLTGVSATASVGAVTFPKTVSITGVSATGSVGGGAVSSWTPAALGALDRLRWDFMDTSSLTVSGGAVTAITNKGSLGSAGNLTASAAPNYAGGVMDTSNGGYIYTSGINVANVFSDMQTGLWYGIVTFAGGVVWWKAENWGMRLGFESPSRVDWPSDDSGRGNQLNSWTQTLDSTVPKILTVRRTLTGKTVYLNGTPVKTTEGGTDTNAFTGGVSSIVLGANDTSGALRADATFRGVNGIIDDNTLDTQQNVEGWLAWSMYDTGDTQFVTALPSDHPYKSTRPTVGSNSLGVSTPLNTDASPSLTGLAASSAVGVTSTANDKAVTGLSATGAVGSLSFSVSKSVSIAGLQATSAVGITTTKSDVNKSLTGVNATTALGSTSTSISEALAGLSATSAVGQVTHSHSVSLTGLSATTAVGLVGKSITVADNHLVLNDGSSPIDLNNGSSVDSNGGVDISVAAAIALGTVTTSSATSGSVSLTGLSATSAIGSLAKTQSIALTGLQPTSALGTVTTASAKIVNLTGVSATGYASVVAVATTFDVGNKSATITLTNGALTATKLSNDITYSIARSTSAKSSGKYVAKVTASTFGVAGFAGFGITNSTFPLDGNWLGQGASSVGIYGDGTTWFNGANMGTIPFGPYFAFDLDNGTVRTSTDGVNWSVTKSFTTPTGGVYLTFLGYKLNDTLTADFAPTGWTLAGFTTWGSTSSTGALAVAESISLTGLAATASLGDARASISNALTGLQATSATGAVIGSVSVFAPFAGLSATTALGSLAISKSVSLTGLQAAGGLGDVQAGTGRNVSITGLSAASALGSVTIKVDGSATLTGLAAASALGSVVPNVSNNLTGLSASGAVGTVSVTAQANASAALTGLQATGSIGSTSGSVTKTLTGLQAAASVGSPLPAASLALTGLSATSSVGSVAKQSAIALVGVSAASAVGQTTSFQISTSAPVAGLNATGATGAVSVTTGSGTPISGVSAIGSVGVVGKQATVSITGVNAASAVGTASTGLTVSIQGFAAISAVGAIAKASGAQITGAQATGSVGGLGFTTTIQTNGVSATGSVGLLKASGLAPLGGAGLMMI